jgi:NADPH:quinone reductase-like Zn-dependent oxidoreductase
MVGGLFTPKHRILGADVAGRVEAVGSSARQFRPGDEVLGEVGYGGFAEYVAAPESTLARKPANISFAEAAGVPMTGLTALQSLRDHGQIASGQKVLVNGASGGIGTIGVQLACHFGAEVTGVCSTRNLELVRSLGASHVVDYTEEDFTRTGRQYDLILDCVGNRSVGDCKRALVPGGICVVAGMYSLPLLFQHMLLGKRGAGDSGKRLVVMNAQIVQEDLVFLAELLEAGAIKPVIDRRYPLAETAEALRYLEKGHARGKVVVTVDENGEKGGE